MFLSPMFSRMRCHAFFTRSRTRRQNHVSLFAGERPPPVCGGRGCQTWARWCRVHGCLAWLRSQDHSPRPTRSLRLTGRSSRTMPKKRGGRKRLIDSQPQVDANFQQVLKDHTAGDPIQPDSLWTNLSKEEISRRLEEQGTPASPKIAQQLLDLHHIGRRQAFKNVAMGQHKDRNAQFENIATLKARYLDSLDPVLSIDTKKRELLGLFYRDGKLYVQETQQVWDHDFPSFGTGVVIPHGLYDLKRNSGYLNLGTSRDTSEFACDSIWQWWQDVGQVQYPHAKSLLLLCDGGGSNSASRYLFKEGLQQLAQRLGLE